MLSWRRCVRVYWVEDWNALSASRLCAAWRSSLLSRMERTGRQVYVPTTQIAMGTAALHRTGPVLGPTRKVAFGACAADPGQPRRVAVGLQAGSRARVRYRSLSGRCRRAQSARHPSAAGTVGQRRPCADSGRSQDRDLTTGFDPEAAVGTCISRQVRCVVSGVCLSI